MFVPRDLGTVYSMRGACEHVFFGEIYRKSPEINNTYSQRLTFFEILRIDLRLDLQRIRSKSMKNRLRLAK